VLASYLVRGASTTAVMLSPAWKRTASLAGMAQAAAVAAFRRLARVPDREDSPVFLLRSLDE